MSVIVTLDVLNEAVRGAAPTAKVRTPHPMLACLRLVAGDNRLTIEANNLSMCVKRVVTQVQVESPFTTAVNAERFASALATMDSETVTLVPSLEGLTIRSGDGELALPTLADKDFPPFATMESPIATFTLPGKSLARLFKLTRFCVKEGGAKFSPGGVQVSVNGKVYACATDDHRLAYLPAADAKAEGNAAALVPPDAAQVIERTFADAESVECSVSDHAFRAHNEDATVVTNLIEGTFPIIDRFIARDGDNMLSANVPELAAIVRRALVTSDEINRTIRAELSGKGIRLLSRAADRGRCDAACACKYVGEDMTIGINGQILAEVLGQLEGEWAEIRFSSPSTALKIFSGDYVYVQMPVNLA